MTFSEVPIPETPDRRKTIAGIAVTADAVKVRLTVVGEDLSDGPETLDQRLFVGTPR